MSHRSFSQRRPLDFALEGIAVIVLAALAATVIGLHFTQPEIPYGRESDAFTATVRARITDVRDIQITSESSGLVIVDQTLSLRILSAGRYQGTEIVVPYHGMGSTQRIAEFTNGQQALVMISSAPDGSEYFQVADHVRLFPLAALTLTFVAVTLLVGRRQGLRALLGLVLSVVIIGGFVIPQILAQRNAVLIGLSGAGLLVAGTVYLIQGWNAIGHTALFGLLGSLGVSGLLTLLWTSATQLSGFGSEETLYLQAIGAGIQMRGLLLAGMIIGVAGVLDDVVLAQSVAVFELAAANQTMTKSDLLRSGMRVGVTHLASMVNTLVLAYTSTALPMMLLFYLFPEPWYLTINRELIAQEIVRALVGSLGLMVAVPLTTLIATGIATKAVPGASHTGSSQHLSDSV